MKIAVQGCAHGELELIYDSLQFIEETEKIKIDLLICCGDFQACRNKQDLKCMAIPPKYYNLCTFYKYYSGEKKAPVLTIFIGGNHEASNYLQELPYGGWVAPNIYYMGYSGVVNIGGIRIAGISGIYKGQDYFKGHFEILPYNSNSIRSVYHIRQLDIFRLKQLTPNIDIFLSHDWPAGICDFGNVAALNKNKPFLKNDIESGKLGSKPCEELLKELKPSYWFSAHLHCKFAALVPHSDGTTTKFLALDKCLPQRKYLQILDIPHRETERLELCYDLEWLTVLHLTNHLLHTKNSTTFMPGPTCSSGERWSFKPTIEEQEKVFQKFGGNLVIPNNFAKTALFQSELSNNESKRFPKIHINPQTNAFCKKLDINDPVALLLTENNHEALVDNTEFEPEINNSDFVEFDSDTDLDLSQPSMNSTPVKHISSLVLPEPINEVTEYEELHQRNLETDNEINNSLAKDLLVLTSNSSENKEDSTKSPQEEVEKIEKEEKMCVDSPTAKKFKRRNANIYCADETES